MNRNSYKGWMQWGTPVISNTWRAELGKIPVQGQFRQKVSKGLSESISQMF
jgi:hypothetical protein